MEESNLQQSSLVVDGRLKDNVEKIAKWAKFLAIVGFFITGLIVLAAFSIGSLFTALSEMTYELPIGTGMGSILSVSYLLFALLYFLPCLYLYRFAKKSQRALQSEDQDLLVRGFEQMTRFFRFVGILTLIYLIIMALAFIGVLIGVLLGASLSGVSVPV